MKGAVFGIQRAGTNFTETLLKEHFKVSVANKDKNYIWKHSHNFDLSKFDSDNFNIYIVKYPYSWIESIRRKSVDIIKRHPEIKTDNNTKTDFKGIDLYKLAKLYNDHTLWWHKEEVKKAAKYIYVHYEKLIHSDDDIKHFLNVFQSTYSINPPHDISVIKHLQKVSQSDKWTEETRDMYLNKKLLTLEWKHIEEINEAFSDDLFQVTGYKRITSEVELKENHK